MKGRHYHSTEVIDLDEICYFCKQTALINKNLKTMTMEICKSISKTQLTAADQEVAYKVNDGANF